MKSVGFVIAFLLSFLVLFAQGQMTTEKYIETYADFAVEEMQRSGVPASITLGQGILESGSGNSRLATEGNNHFGIKCHSDWKGSKIYEDDDEDQECFRKYNSADESFRDHSEFLRKHSRYAFLFELDKDDYQAWAKGLKQAGYATNPKYASILIGLIEKYNLFLYDDRDGSGSDLLASDSFRKTVQPGFTDNWVIDPFNREVLENNARPLIIARQGDNVIALAQEFDMMPWQFYKYNDMDKKTDTITPGQIVYLKPKCNKAEKGYETHVVKNGETLWGISQEFGVKINKLRKRNNLDKGVEVNTGDTLYLRKNPDAKSFLGL